MSLEEKLGVPLQPEEETVGGVLDGFDDSIGRHRRSDEDSSDGLHRLMMGTVDLHARASNDSPEEAPLGDRDAMGDPRGRSRLPVSQRATHLGGNILIKIAAAGHVHRLHASANGQRGNAVSQREADKA